MMIVFKPGARDRRQRAPGFLKSFLFARRYVCVCACASALEGINNKSCETHA